VAVAFVVRPEDRRRFRRCRRQWDLGATTRRNLGPAEPEPTLDPDRALRDALAVYYFPGMWEWNREVVLPLTHQALEKALTKQGAGERLAEGKAVLDRYLAWAPSVDRFWPVRVETDFDVALPDPDHPGADLVSPDGDPLRYEGRIDMLVVDEHDAYWVVRHRLTTSGFADPDLLALDDESTAACWAWELFYLGMRIAGTIHNEIRPDGEPPDPSAPVTRPRASHAFAQARAAGHRRMYAQAEEAPTEVVVEEGGTMFRRTRIPRSRAELEAAAANLVAEAREMAAPSLIAWPSPGDHCLACEYRPPCLAMMAGDDPGPILSARYQERPPPAPEEGRLGGVTWSMNRGAAPPPRWRRR
jgi:hypothetical protein